MTQTIRLWEIGGSGSPEPLPASKLDLEERLEDWLASDISLLSPDLLVFGRQVKTEHGGVIDLLCVDVEGNVVVVELKRGMTPRDVTAQVIDYATWVRDLSNEEVHAIADRYLGPNESLDRAFEKRFGIELPEVLNDRHRMIVVGTGLDASTERIIGYLSEDFGVGINAVTFGYFRTRGGAEILGRVFLIEPETAEARHRRGSKRAPALTVEQLQHVAEEAGVGVLYRSLESGLGSRLRCDTSRSSLRFPGSLQRDLARVLQSHPAREFRRPWGCIPGLLLSLLRGARGRRGRGARAPSGGSGTMVVRHRRRRPARCGLERLSGTLSHAG